MKSHQVVGSLISPMVLVVVSVALPTAKVTAASVVFVVNSTTDRADVVADGTCQTPTPGECTLRAALNEADAITGAPVLIQFAIPGNGVKRINVATRLPLIDNGTAGITIDGFTQPGTSVEHRSLGRQRSSIDRDRRHRPERNRRFGVPWLEQHGPWPGDPRIQTGHPNDRAAAQFNASPATSSGCCPTAISTRTTRMSCHGSPCIDVNNGASQEPDRHARQRRTGTSSPAVTRRA